MAIGCYQGSAISRKPVVARYFEGFRKSDHGMILECLTEDVVWEIHGFKVLRGKSEFDAEIENPAFTGSPTLTLAHCVEEGDTIIATGRGEGKLAAGDSFTFQFCTLFEFAGQLIAKVESFVVAI
ncbi:MAG: nuclear transport factor 2 family protein [Fimbriimonadaceae bacterium]